MFKQISVFYIHAVAVGVEIRKVTWPAAWPTVLLSQFCTPTVTAHRHCIICCTADRVMSTVITRKSWNLVLNTLLNRLSSKCTVSLQLLISVNLHHHYGILRTVLTKEMY